MKRIILWAMAVVGSLAAVADVTVSNTFARQTWTSDATVMPSTTKTTELPDVGETPIFWFDCSDRTGWTVDEHGMVTSIPSKTGDGRSLATSFLTPGNFTGWGETVPAGALLVENQAALQGGAALDFGPLGSKRGLIFSPDPATATGTYLSGSNTLDNIGTVIAVYDSTNGGGNFLGGGYAAPWEVDNYGDPYYVTPVGSLWHRGNSLAGNSVRSFRDPMLNVARSQNWSTTSPDWLINGAFYQDGIPTTPHFAGFNGGWSVVSFVTRDTGKASATGVGIGNCEYSEYTGLQGHQMSGGQKIAEMVFYAGRLSDENRAKVEAYLSQKWFGRKDRGYHGNAYLGDLRLYRDGWQNSTTAGEMPPSLTVNADAGENLTIGRLRGGHGRNTVEQAKLTKNGAGTLTLGDASESGLDVQLDSGTLAFARKAYPTALPARISFHFDASQASSLDCTSAGGVNYVSVWNPVESLPYAAADYVISAAMLDEAKRPVYVPDALGAGLGLVDFGAMGSGRRMQFTKKTNTATAMQIDGFCTVIAVVGAQEGGGYLLGSGGSLDSFGRDMSSSPAYSAPLLGTSTHPARHPLLNGRDGALYIDGLRVAVDAGYPDPGYHVIAMRTPGNRLRDIGYLNAEATTGGFKLAELVLYDRSLDEGEILDASAYLSKKWFKREFPGYAKNTDVDDSRAVTLGGEATISVDADKARVEGVVATGRVLHKTGAGALEVGGKAAMVGTLDVADGKVVLAADGISALAQVAQGSIFHLDATDRKTIDVTPVNGTNFVYTWHDKGFRNLVWMDVKSRVQTLTTDAADLEGLSGDNLSVVKLDGDVASKEAGLMIFGRAIDSIREAFIVWNPTISSASILGSNSDGYDTGNANTIDFVRGNSGEILLGHGTQFAVTGGKVFMDGVQVAATEVAPNGEWHLYEFQTAKAAHASCLGKDRSSKTGASSGCMYAEVILYSRVLSERERIATRNYLMKKWFGKTDDQLTPLPAESGASVIDQIVTAENRTSSVDFERDGQIGKVTGGGVLVKGGMATARIADGTLSTARVAVAQGTLSVRPTFGPIPVTDGMIFRVDATKNVNLAADGKTVTSWNDADGRPFTMVPAPISSYQKTAQMDPTVELDAGTGLPYVRMLSDGSTHSSGLKITSDGSTQAYVTDIRSVFWVLKSPERESTWLFGQGTGDTSTGGPDGTQSLAFFMGSNGGLVHGTQAAAHVRTANWSVNGHARTSSQQNSFSGGWDIISMVMTNEEHGVSAGWLARDGRNKGDNSDAGKQMLQEIVVYDRVVSDDERAQIEQHLKDKWRLAGAQDDVSLPNALEVEVAAGAKLDLCGVAQSFAALSGGGTVTNGDLIVERLSNGNALKVAGDLTFADGAVWDVPFEQEVCNVLSVGGRISALGALTVHVTGLENAVVDECRDFVLAEMGDVAGAGSLRAARVTGKFSSSMKASLVVSDGRVLLRLKSGGLTLFVR